jgi:hypothetical protein
MSGFTGTWRLAWFTVRRDRVRIAVWVLSVTALVVLTVASIKGLYPTQADLDEAAAAAGNNAAAIAFNGPVQGLDTVGGEVAFQAGTFGLILVAMMSLLMIGRYTRAEEENGRTEFLRATVLGRDAPTASALVVVTGMNLLISGSVTVSLIGQGLATAGSVSFGASFLAIGLVFSALTLVTAQISENSRVASGLAGIVVAFAFATRAVGDIRRRSVVLAVADRVVAEGSTLCRRTVVAVGNPGRGHGGAARRRAVVDGSARCRCRPGAATPRASGSRAQLRATGGSGGTAAARDRPGVDRGATRHGLRVRLDR